MRRSLPIVLFAALLTLPTHSSITARQAQPQPQVSPAGHAQTPEQFFGFRIGTDGELARYPKIVEYLQHLSKTTNRVKFEELGKTTMGNPYVLATISAPENLAKLNRLVEINRRLADPRGLTEAEAKRLAQEGRAFYFVYGTIHSTEVGNTQSLDRDRAPAGDRQQRRDPADPRQRRRCCSCRRRIPTASTSSSTTGTRRRARRSRASIRTSTTSTSATTTTATGSCSRRRRRGSPSRSPERVQADHHARHAPAGHGRIADLRAAVRRSLRSERPPDPRAGDHDASARRWRRRSCRKGRRGVEWPGALRPVGPGAAVHGLPRPAAHPDRDRERRISPIRSSTPRERRADRSAGAALELPAAVPQERVAAARDRRLRQHRRVRRHGARREVPRHVARELLQDPRRLGEPDRGRPTPSSLPRRSAIRSRPSSCSTSCASARSRSTRRRRRSRPAASDYAAGSWVDQDWRSPTARSRRRCSSGRSIRTCGCFPADRRSRRTTSPGTRSGC